jgi:hypothetical protein
LLLAVAAIHRAAAADVQAIETGGSGVLTMCQSRMVYQDCRDYHHITVPTRINVGDSFEVDFGSNPKQYQFPAARIERDGERCVIYSEATGDGKEMNRIEVIPCHEASGPR